MDETFVVVADFPARGWTYRAGDEFTREQLERRGFQPRDFEHWQRRGYLLPAAAAEAAAAPAAPEILGPPEPDGE